MRSHCHGPPAPSSACQDSRRLPNQRLGGACLRAIFGQVNHKLLADLPVLTEVKTLALLARANPKADENVCYPQDEQSHNEGVGEADDGQDNWTAP